MNNPQTYDEWEASLPRGKTFTPRDAWDAAIEQLAKKHEAVPDGWVPVPANPTQRMLNQTRWMPSGHAVSTETALFVWSAMIAAAKEGKP